MTLPALAIVMVASLTQIPIRSFLPLKTIVKPVLLTIVLNYFVFALVMLPMAWFLFPERELWVGFVIIAIAPPGVAVAPFTSILGGDVKYSLAGVIGAYIAALIIIPLAGLILVGQSFIQPLRLIIIFSELIVAPLIISQIFIMTKVDKYILRFKGYIVNWGLFIVIFTVIGLNRNIFFGEPLTLLKISLICFVTIIGLGLVYEFLTKRLKLDPGIMLLGVVKNGGFAAATALTLFGERASLPSAVVSVFLLIFLLYLSFRARKK
ncbi:bile acid:sodium symporter family protein [Actinomycetota bacterium]